MIIDFSAGNFLSFYNRKLLSFKAKGISELKENVVTLNKHKLLRSAVVYGANSSGKSNLIKALYCMREMVLMSVKLNDTDELPYFPFLLNTKSENEPTFFEIAFLDGEQRYRYGFEYNKSRIENEWLFKGEKEKALFLRTPEGIGIDESSFLEGVDKEGATNNNRLFISLVAQLGGSLSKKILEWFNSYKILSGIEHDDYKKKSSEMLFDRSDGFNDSLALFQSLKLGFKDIIPVKTERPKSTQITLQTIHGKFDSKGNSVGLVAFDKDKNESEGTKKIIDFSGPIFDTLRQGTLLIIDELDAKLHPLITLQIVGLFNNPKTNPNNAQLLFATHDTNLLSTDLFRRDQIWFTEKDEFEQTDLFSLYDFNLPDGTKVRNDSNIEKNYIRGRYGAIPFITSH